MVLNTVDGFYQWQTEANPGAMTAAAAKIVVDFDHKIALPPALRRIIFDGFIILGKRERSQERRRKTDGDLRPDCREKTEYGTDPGDLSEENKAKTDLLSCISWNFIIK